MYGWHIRAGKNGATYGLAYIDSLANAKATTHARPTSTKTTNQINKKENK